MGSVWGGIGSVKTVFRAGLAASTGAGPVAVPKLARSERAGHGPSRIQPSHRQTTATAAQITTPSVSGNSEATTVQRRLPVSLYIV